MFVKLLDEIMFNCVINEHLTHKLGVNHLEPST